MTGRWLLYEEMYAEGMATQKIANSGQFCVAMMCCEKTVAPLISDSKFKILCKLLLVPAEF